MSMENKYWLDRFIFAFAIYFSGKIVYNLDNNTFMR